MMVMVFMLCWNRFGLLLGRRLFCIRIGEMVITMCLHGRGIRNWDGSGTLLI